MNELTTKTQTTFKNIFETEASHVIRAPGRVNLIGEHTDYNDGFVFPAALNFATVIAARKRDDAIVKVVSLDYGNEIDEFDTTKKITHSEKPWANYVRGTVKTLIDNGFEVGGAELAISGDVPQGAGLSSSASLEVAVGYTFKTLFTLEVTNKKIALMGQEAENKFVGCNCGIMDQLISACGVKGKALLIDCRTLDCEPCEVPADLSIVIINSNMKRELVGSEYNTRRESCEEAAAFFGVKALRDVSIAQLEEKLNALPDVIGRRARHIVTENQRTLDMGKALNQKDYAHISRLMAGSHASMKDDFEITIPEIDFLVNTGAELLGEKGGIRMTGGGFGGCVVALVPNEMVDTFTNVVCKKYVEKTKITATVYVCKASAGVEVIQG